MDDITGDYVLMCVSNSRAPKAFVCVCVYVFQRCSVFTRLTKEENNLGDIGFQGEVIQMYGCVSVQPAICIRRVCILHVDAGRVNPDFRGM